MSFGEVVDGWQAPERPAFRALSGRYCRVAPLSVEMVEELYHANAVDDAIWDYLPYGPFASVDLYRDWVAEVAGGSDPMFFAVQDVAHGSWAGVASYLRIAPEAGSIEVGHINFSAGLQRTRAATEALYLMMGWAFEAGYRRFEWKCNALNIPSRRAAERLGLSYEGVFRQAGVVKGRNRDTAWFAAIGKEWCALSAAFDSWLAPENFDADGRQIIRLSELTRPVLVTRDPALA